MNKIEKIDKLIEEGKRFIGNNIYRDDPEFQSWNNSVIRFSEITFGKCSVTDNFKNRLYTFSCYGINTPRKDLVRQFEKDVKITLNDLENLKDELDDIETIPKNNNRKANEKEINIINNINNSPTFYVNVNTLINQIEDDVNIDEETHDKLLDAVNSINSSVTKKDKWKYAKEICKFLLDKGMDICIAYLPQIIAMINK